MKKNKEKELLLLITNYCNECEIKDFCCNEECILFNIKEIITQEE